MNKDNSGCMKESDVMTGLFFALLVLGSSRRSCSFVVRDVSNVSANHVVTGSRVEPVNEVKRGNLLKRVKRSTLDLDEAQKKLLENLANLTEVLANSSGLRQHHSLSDHAFQEDQSNPEVTNIVLKPLMSNLSPSPVSNPVFSTPERSAKASSGPINVLKSAENTANCPAASNETQRQLLNALFNRLAVDFEQAQALLMERNGQSVKLPALTLTAQSLACNDGRITRLTWTKKKYCEKRKKVNFPGFGCDGKMSRARLQTNEEDDKSEEIAPSDSVNGK